MTPTEITRLKQEIEALEREQAENDGATRQLNQQLSELGFSDATHAKAGIETWRKEKAKLEEQCDAGLAAYRESYKDRLGAPGSQ